MSITNFGYMICAVLLCMGMMDTHPSDFEVIQTSEEAIESYSK